MKEAKDMNVEELVDALFLSLKHTNLYMVNKYEAYLCKLCKIEIPEGNTYFDDLL